jgi:hypothetical protein
MFGDDVLERFDHKVLHRHHKIRSQLAGVVRFWPLYVACGKRFTYGSAMLRPIWEIAPAGFYEYVSEQRLTARDGYGFRKAPPLEADLIECVRTNAPVLLDVLRKRGIEV